MDDLRPCARCGSVPLLDPPDRLVPYWAVSCEHNFHFNGYYASKEADAIIGWNAAQEALAKLSPSEVPSK